MSSTRTIPTTGADSGSAADTVIGTDVDRHICRAPAFHPSADRPPDAIGIRMIRDDLIIGKPRCRASLPSGRPKTYRPVPEVEPVPGVTDLPP